VDKATLDKSRRQLIEELSAIGESVGIDPAEMTRLMTPICLLPDYDEKNTGSGVSQEMKWYAKHHRKHGMHVTPTVAINGIEDGAISSGWTQEEWLAHLNKIISSR